MANTRINRAVFLDRDGVIVKEVGYLSSVDQLKIIPGVPRAIKELRHAGFKVVVVTNQSGVARGYFSLSRLKAIHRALKAGLADAGAKWDGLYYSPHAADSGHVMRKPNIGMLKSAQRRFSLDLKSSYFVGDTTTDIMTARNAGCQAILVRTGKAGRDGKFPKAKPDAIVASLASAARWIMRQEREIIKSQSS
jgi:histidinol-phosphate phosphatase family protein